MNNKIEGRDEFVRENAQALLKQRDDKIKNYRKTIRRLEDSRVGLKKTLKRFMAERQVIRDMLEILENCDEDESRLALNTIKEAVEFTDSEREHLNQFVDDLKSAKSQDSSKTS